MQERLLFRGSDAVLSRYGATQVHGGAEQRDKKPLPDLGVWLEHRKVDVAVSCVAAANAETTMDCREPAGRLEVDGEAVSWNDDIDYLVRARSLGSIEGPLSRSYE